jgi:hypothetical protein
MHIRSQHKLPTLQYRLLRVLSHFDDNPSWRQNKTPLSCPALSELDITGPKIGSSSQRCASPHWNKLTLEGSWCGLGAPAIIKYAWTSRSGFPCIFQSPSAGPIQVGMLQDWCSCQRLLLVGVTCLAPSNGSRDLARTSIR